MRETHRHIALIVGLGVLLAAAGMTSGVDSIVYYVFGIVDKIGNDPLSIIKPVYNPEPMFTHAYRPLSTAAVKLGGWLFGRDAEGMRWHTFAHGLGLIVYGLAARRCLKAHALSERVSTAAAVLAMLTPTVLFSAWTIPEFDMVGAAWVLLAAAELCRGHRGRAVPFLALAILTKETTAILMLAYLLSHVFWRRRDPGVWWLLGAYSVALLAAVAPILMVRPEVTQAFNVSDDEFALSHVAFLFFHNASQVFYVLGPAGALLLWTAGVGGRLWMLALGVAVLFLGAPLLRYYNHYESMVFSSWPWVLAWFAVATAGLFGVIWRGTGPQRALALACALGFGGLLAGPVLASFSRADLSARLYAPLIPMLLGLGLDSAGRLWSRAATAGHIRLQRTLVALVTACVVWMPVAGAISTWQFTAARFPVERAGKTRLLESLEPPCPVWVFYTNRDQELAQEELALLGEVHPAVADCTRLIQLSVTETGDGGFWDYPKRLMGHDQWRKELHPTETEERLWKRQRLPQTVHLYVQHARSTMGPTANAALNANFDWATGRMPETEAGYLRQTVGVIYTPLTPLERVFENAAPYKGRWSTTFFQIPIYLNELPRRLLLGLPLVETYDYRAALYSIPKGVRPRGHMDMRGPTRDSGT